MSAFISWYLTVGCAIYIICFIDAILCDKLSVFNQTWASIGRGFLGIFLWPLVIVSFRRS